MRKRILLAEGSDTVRKVAESVLRQNGFEVISVSSGEKALEVIAFSRPDLIITAAGLTGKGHKLLYQYVQEMPQVSSVPVALFAEAGESGLPFPEESIIYKPFEPSELIEKVSALVGKSAPKQHVPASGSVNPLGDVQLEDDFLDAALGLDRIDVTDSEVMDKTTVKSKRPKPEPSDKSVGFAHNGDEDLRGDSGKVESLLIHEDSTDIRSSEPSKKKDGGMSSTGGLDILQDQYGLIDSGDSMLPDQEKSVHDYDWFLNEMKSDSHSKPGSTTVPTTGTDFGNDSSGLEISDNSSMVDPITKVDSKRAAPPEQNRKEGVDKFIDEFKKEIEKFQMDEPESITIDAETSGEGKGDDNLSWQDSLEKLTPESVEIFTRQFVAELADKVAEKISAKIDGEKLLTLLRKEIIDHIKNSRKTSG